MYRTARQLVIFSVMILVIRDRRISQHGHHIGKYNARPLILVRINKDTQALEIIRESKHFSGCGTFFRDPNSHAVPVETTPAMNFERNLNL